MTRNQMIREAVDNLNGRATYPEIKEYINKKWKDVNEGTINAQIIVLTVNHPSRIHYPENKKPRTSNGQYDLFYTTGRGQVVKYNPTEHGVWEIFQNEFGGLGCMKLLRLTIIGLILLLPITASATVDFLSVNKITKEYYWGDEDNLTGWIGWTSVPEGQLETAEDVLKKLGYTETFYPYKIESYIALLVLILVLGQYIIRRKVKKNYTQ